MTTVATGFTKPVQVRMDQENYLWLKGQSQVTERSMNYIFNKVVMDARIAAEKAHLQLQPQGART